ncbi:nucleotide sugar dehydrogenase [Halorussus halophilus]|uniref:nucleotide sugar dehydrogenase n=1 Tax=Halorussus halophilus TaxID=2650975 RepID=UPI001300CCFC|nr:nucleotide sugar dehydrogenase [Halorussus halophilus]
MNSEASSDSSIVGLGYVGLTLAMAFDDAGYSTVGYDIDGERIRELRDGHDPTGEFGDERIAESDVTFTDSPKDLADSRFVLVALPTPVDETQTPDLDNLEFASETIGRHISDGTTVVFESTLYPGATREVLRPALERGAGEQGGVDFSVGYSPERIVPGGGGPKLAEATKVVSAEDEATLVKLVALYESLAEGEVYAADTIETAEASKCLENTQRDVNIALVNEFTMACRQLDFELDPYEVLETAKTKWNFHDYEPGVVGGHCIPVDPHYLRHRFEESGYTPNLIRAARGVNREMRRYAFSLTLDALYSAKFEEAEQHPNLRTEGALPESVAGSRLLLLGFAYKPNVPDLRNSLLADIVSQLRELDLELLGWDPFYEEQSLPEKFDLDVQSEPDFTDVDAAVVLTPHDEIREFDLESMARRMADDPVLVDIGNAFDREKAAACGFTYRRL